MYFRKEVGKQYKISKRDISAMENLFTTKSKEHIAFDNSRKELTEKDLLIENNYLQMLILRDTRSVKTNTLVLVIFLVIIPIIVGILLWFLE